MAKNLPARVPGRSFAGKIENEIERRSSRDVGPGNQNKSTKDERQTEILNSPFSISTVVRVIY